MFKSKQDVDRHVRNILGRIKDEKEKTSRGYQISRLYFEIGDYESAKRYLTNFLSLRENVPQAHKLLGQIYESLNQNDMAIKSFRRSLELDSNQHDLVQKVGNLFANPAVNKSGRGGEKNIEEHMKTIKQLVLNKRGVEAYQIIKDIEGDQLYKHSLEWYEYLVDNFTVIKNNVDEDEITLFIYHLLSILRLTYLQLPTRNMEKCNNTLLMMDELLWKAEKISDKRKEWKYFRDELQGHLFYLAGTLLLKKAEKKLLPYKDVLPITVMCYLTSCSYQSLQQHTDWYNLINKENLLFSDIYSFSHYRLCQAGHMLHIMDKSTNMKPVQHYLQQLCATPWNKTLHSLLFPWIRNIENKGSFILMSTTIYNRSLSVPNLEEVIRYDKEACRLVQDRLPDIVWILLQRFSHEQIDYDIDLNFSKLQYGESDLSSSSIESLSQLDIEAFLYATVRCASLKTSHDNTGRHPFLLPPVIDNTYCTPEQIEWWKFAFCFYSNNKLTDFGKMRRTLQHGLEVIRLIGNNHGMSVNMLVYLAHCFESKMNPVINKDVEYTASQISYIKDRAYHYWYNALKILEQIESNGGNIPGGGTTLHLFPEIDKELMLDPESVETLKEEIKLAIGKRLQDDGIYDMALDYYKSLSSPWASFYSSEVYRSMGEREAELSDQRKIYLEKSLSCLHTTLDRTQGDKNHELNQYVYPYIREIERLIRQSENEWEEDASNNSRYHTPQGKVDLEPPYQQNTSTPSSNNRSTSARRLNLTPQAVEKKHLQPSPERLDSQIRQLSHSQESLLNVVLRRNEELAKTNVDLAASLKECMETIKELKFEMYHRSAVFGGMNASRSYAGMQSPYKTDMLPADLISPAPSGHFMDSPKPSMIPSQMSRNDRMSQMYQYNDMMDPNSCQMNMQNRRMQQYGGMPEMEANFNGSQYFPGSSNQDSTLSRLPGPGYFSPIKGTNRVPQADFTAPPPAPVPAPTPVQSHSQPDTSSPFQVLFCGKVTYGSQQYVILKIISIGSLTQVILEPTTGMGTVESYDVKNLTLQPSMSPLLVICKHKSSEFEKTLHLTFETVDRSNVFTQILSQFVKPAKSVSAPSLPNETPQVQGLPSFSGFNFPSQKVEPQVPSSPNVPESPKASEHNTSAEEYEPNVSFEPVIALPELVPVTTGEEGESVFYSDRGKLFRYDTAAKSWKERGVGEFKILKNDKNVYRFLMRRDQVLKICANHVLSKEMKLSPLANSDKAWCWSADDFADEEVNHEKFALKFKTADAAQKFKTEFEKCQSLMPATNYDTEKKGVQETSSKLSSSSKGSTAGTVTTSTTSSKATTSSTTKSIFGSTPTFGGSATFGLQTASLGQTATNQSGGLFGSSSVKPAPTGFSDLAKTQDPKPKEGSPFAGFSLNAQSSQKKDMKEPEKTASPFAGFSFTAPTAPNTTKTSPLKPPVLDASASKPDSSKTKDKQPSLSELFKSNNNMWECNGCLVQNKAEVKKCPACNTLKPGEKPEPPNPSKVPVSATGQFSLGSKGGFKFGGEDKSNDKTPVQETGKPGGFVFGSSATGVFTPPQPSATTAQIPDTAATSSPFAGGFKFSAQPQEDKTITAGVKKDVSIVKSILESDKCDASDEFKAEFGDGKPQDKSVSLADLFKNKSGGTWECDGCLCHVKNELKQCPACMTMKPGEKNTDLPTIKSASAASAVAPGGGFSFVPKPGTDPTQGGSSGFTFGNKSVPDSTSGGFSFGSPAPPSNQDASGNKPLPPASSGFSFGTSAAPTSNQDASGSKPVQPASSGFTFGTVTAPTTSSDTSGSKPVQPASSGFSFGTAADPVSSMGSDASKTVQPASSSLFGTSVAPTKPEKTSEKPVAPQPPNIGQKDTSGFAFGNTASVSEQKDAKSGFSFSTKPAIGSFTINPTSTKASQVPVPETAPNKVAGSAKFCFTPQKTPNTSLVIPGVQGTSTPNPFSSSTTSGFTFNMTPSKPTGTTKSADDKANTSNSDDYYVNSEGDDSHIVFEPVIPLPDKVEVKTMEEDEDVLFNHRSKLFRFVNGEWKEKGLGNIKILEHRETKQRRVVMRREQVHKVCCNHLLTADLVIKVMSKSDGKALVWFASDFSDEEEKVEQLSAKFKTAEIASEFQTVFEESTRKAKEGIQGADTKESSAVVEDDKEDDDDVIYEETETASPEEIALARKYLLPDHFYLYTRKPPCPGCRGCDDGQTQQKQEDTKKKTSRIPVSSKAAELEKSEPPSSKPSTPSLFGFKSDGGASFASLASSQTTVSPFSKDLGDKDLSAVTFQGGETTFSSLASAGENVFSQSKGNKPFKWSGAGTKLFGAAGNDDSTDQADDSTDDVKNDDIHFEPIIPLPDLVEVVTGEEDWESIFAHRSKLFRFDKATTQWKERGIGEIKIMKFHDKVQYRVLFRREQVLKVVCNHMINEHIEMKPMNTSEKAWCWVAEDFSEEEGKMEQFAVRFKTVELAQKFKEVFDSVIQALKNRDESVEDKNDNNKTEEGDDDVVFDKRATLFTLDGEQWTRCGSGNLKIVYSEDLEGNSVQFVNDDNVACCNHLVCKEYTIELERTKKYCVWSAVDFSTKQQKEQKFKAQFSSPNAAEEFFNKFRDSIKLAKESGLTQLDDEEEEEDGNTDS